MGLTTDRNDPRLGHGVDQHETPQHSAYLVLSDDEIAKGFVRPVRCSYIHMSCGTVTTMNQKIAETYAREPFFYGATYCMYCKKHLPVSEFRWVDDGELVGS